MNELILEPLWRNEYSLMLRPSAVHGLGVFAVYDIPAGALLFNNTGCLRKVETKMVPVEWQKYCIHLNEHESVVPHQFDRMEIGWFINHSDQPNIAHKILAPAAELMANEAIRKVYSLRSIKAGEELLIDYNDLGEPESMKEGYYQK
ncbi:SET domain-containing protein [Candidatus Dependentiae bacterium]|nr:SET domain-containing protein [Candidatus Dependentiae bacterium]